MSAPTCAILHAISAKISMLLGIFNSPLSSKTPQCPDEEYGQRQISTATSRSSRNLAFNFFTASTTGFSSDKAADPVSS